MTDNKSVIEQPKGISLSENSGILVITRRWLSIKVILLLGVFVLFSNYKLFETDIPSLITMIKYQFHFTMLIVLVGYLGLHYAFFMTLFNKTYLRVDSDVLSIKHSPIPYIGNKQISISEISQIYCMESQNVNRNSGIAINPNQGQTPNYELNAKLHNGQTIRLIKFQGSKQQALYIEQEIERYLGIDDEKMNIRSDVSLDHFSQEVIKEENHYKHYTEKGVDYFSMNRLVENKRLGFTLQTPENWKAQVVMEESNKKGFSLQFEKPLRPLFKADDWNKLSLTGPNESSFVLSVEEKTPAISYEEVMSDKWAKHLMKPVTSKADLDVNGVKGFSVTRQLNGSSLMIRQIWLHDGVCQYHFKLAANKADGDLHDVLDKITNSFKLTREPEAQTVFEINHSDKN